MTPDAFRRLALGLPHVEEGAHMGHADFRVGGRVFATLGNPGPDWAMVRLTPDEQALRAEGAPEVFKPVPGGWGRQGATNVRLDAVDEAAVLGALTIAWRERAPPKLRAARP